MGRDDWKHSFTVRMAVSARDPDNGQTSAASELTVRTDLEDGRGPKSAGGAVFQALRGLDGADYPPGVIEPLLFALQAAAEFGLARHFEPAAYPEEAAAQDAVFAAVGRWVKANRDADAAAGGGDD